MSNSDDRTNEAQRVMVKARIALEHALPRGTHYVCAISCDGFNTWASDLPREEAIDFLRGLIQALERDRMLLG